MAGFRDTSTFQYRVVGAAQVLKTNKQILDSVRKADKQTGTLSDNMRKFGRNVQWTGQRVTFGLSLPLAVFGRDAINVALEIDRAFVQLRRVWEGTADDLNDVLRPAAVKLSNKFGQLQEEVIGVMTEFSKLGIEGASDIIHLTDLTQRISKVFDVDLTQAFSGVKSALKGFNFTAEETEKAMAAINIIADRTAADEGGILKFLSIMSGLARQSGLSINDLGAATATFSANAISASEGATALKFIVQRIQTPTDKATEVMKQFGINLDDVNFKVLDARSQLIVLTKRFLEVSRSGDKLEFANFRSALSQLVGKRQLNRFLILLEDMGKEFDGNTESVSEYFKALRVSNDETENMRVLNQQVETQLGAQSSKWDQLTQELRNTKEEVGNELLPIIQDLIPILKGAFEWFNSLSPETKEWMVKVGLLVVALGPALIVFGSLVEILGTIGKVIGFIITRFNPIAAVILTAITAFKLITDAVNAYKDALDAADQSSESLHNTQMESIRRAGELKKQGKFEEADFLLRQVRNNPIGGHHGLMVPKFAHGGVIPGSSALRDRVPVMAEPGEGIMSKQAMENFLKTGQVAQGGGSTIFNLNVGTMIATPGEQRAFVRDIKRLLFEDNLRYEGAR